MSSAALSGPVVATSRTVSVLAVALLVLMAVLAGGAALRESVTFDEVAHIGAGVSYLIVFLAFCMLGRMSISIRHFTVPIVMLILLIAPLPRLLAKLRTTAPLMGKVASAIAAICALSCLSQLILHA